MTIDRLSDRDYLRHQQYRDASNLDARVALHARFSTNPYGWERWLFDQFDLPPQARLLELGCGPAHLWRRNLDRLPEGWTLALSDISPGMVQAAQSGLSDRRGRLAFLVIDAQAVPFPAQSFDAVIANHMLYHVPDRARALAEMRRVLRPDGRFYASTIGAAHLRELRELTLRFSPQSELWPSGQPVGFTLENGAGVIGEVLGDVEVRRYEDTLVVTEAGPLAAYILSSPNATEDLRARAGELVAFIGDQIARHGPIHILKDSGLLLARS